MGKTVFLFLAALAAAQPAQSATLHPSDLKIVRGTKYPNSTAEGHAPVVTSALSTTLPASQLPGYSELVPYVLRSPDQLDAGSCLYMSLTGIAEWWLARLHPDASRASNGPLDLSERFLMNQAGSQENDKVEDWMTDSVFFFNQAGHSVLNRDYPFTKGWYVEDDDGNKTKSRRGVKGATYDEGYNWIDETDSIKTASYVKLPKFRREILFADDSEDQWMTGTMPDDIVDQIKEALTKNKAPVHILYNHMGYWHANFIVGYDDNADNQNCKFVREFFDWAKKRPGELREQARLSTVPNDKDGLLGEAKKADGVFARTMAAYRRGGGCHPKGIFYVRDSIYEDENGPDYDYDPKNKGEESKYAKPIVMLEYDWVRYLANHATQILLDRK